LARIAGVDLPRDKRVEIGLTYIFGIGRSTSKMLLESTGINPDTRVRELTEDEIARLRDAINENVKVEGDLRRDVSLSIKRLMEIGCYRGLRHRRFTRSRAENQNQRARQKRSPPGCRRQKEVNSFRSVRRALPDLSDRVMGPPSHLRIEVYKKE